MVMMNQRVQLGAFLAALAFSAAAFGEVQVRFSPETSEIAVGETVEISIYADNLQDVVGYGMDFENIGIDVAELLSIQIESPWIKASGLVDDDDDLTALLNPFAGMGASLTGSDVLLAKMTFKATAEGTATLTLGETADDATEGFATSEFAGFLPASYGTGTINVVPEPGMPMMAAIGLLGGHILRRRR